MTEPASVDDRASIAERVRASVVALTAQERKAAQVLLTNYPTAGLAPVAEFAERARVSAPTVLRFVAKLGFLGYPDFQRQLREELEAQLASPLAKPARQLGQRRVRDFVVPAGGLAGSRWRVWARFALCLALLGASLHAWIGTSGTARFASRRARWPGLSEGSNRGRPADRAC